MRILIVTNYYPPSNYGWGYMQLCEEVADGLAARGHAVAVLTSTYRHGDEPTRPYPVHRLLPIEPDWHSGKPAAWQFFAGRRRRERQAVAHLRQLVAGFRPDVIFVWHADGLPKVLFREAEQGPGPAVAYYLAGYLPELPDKYIRYWQARPPRPVIRLLKRSLAGVALRMLAREGKPISLKYEHAICVSDYVRRRLVSQKLISAGAAVIHNGVDLSRFSPNGQTHFTFSSVGLRCLIAGRVVPDKGIHTVLEALAALRTQAASPNITLTILGDGPADYVDYLRKKTSDHHLQDKVNFCSPVPREQMPEVLGQYNTLVLPSEYEEPLARAMQEAMAVGLLVIGTNTGGSGELLVHEKTGLVFEPGNPKSLAFQFSRALNEPELATRLARAGQQEVIAHFNIERTVERTEHYLLGLVESAPDFRQ